ncbi:TetR/AcrR family transcriptional regulator [Pedobacter sp. UBA5917]|jgi:AcrR family transcriptional regulator|uniref:TetR/AcrR family transcriptional regulator n=1 Tax=Pedobacter sp. UBA5917 TaxID=1947061 RepID=UPI0025CF5238|nr:TetR/AcrR family transcriptional regulator [Pedobacter sp. UBA5917]
MGRKITDGPLRNKERTKQKLIDSLGIILTESGFAGLNVMQVAAKANVDRKLVYKYFGGLEGLVKEYLFTKDYWRFSEEQTQYVIEQNKADAGQKMAYQLLIDQLDALMGSEEMRKIITWGISEDFEPLKELNRQREEVGEKLFASVYDDHFKGKDKNLRAIEAILISGIYYLSLYSQNNGTFCGIDVKGEEGQAEIKKSLKQIIDWAYT